MARKKVALLGTGFVLLLLVVLREAGVVDANLYKANFAASQTSSKSVRFRGENRNFSYHLTITHKNRVIHSHKHSYQDLPPIEITATLEDPVYSGNFILPLSKNFQMAYRCEFTSAASASGTVVKGDVEGEVTAEIHGPCTTETAKELAFEQAKKRIISSFDQLND